ncbi:MAG: SDR family oxidoreductase [Bdellovibrionales bacterium]|nr:SDR family oxidoreductase [Bdellovibrionales bacterium]
MNAKEKILVFGGTKGVGRQYVDMAREKLYPASEVLVIARSENLLEDIQSQKESNSIEIKTKSLDISKEHEQEKALEIADEFDPTRVVYFIGGGPFGEFGQKKWSSHDWAYQVNFLFPAKLIHHHLKKNMTTVRQMIFLGSAIAESKADPKSASYSAAKHALLGLMKSVVEEGAFIDLRLFSPGYINTSLMPKADSLRSQGIKVFEPKEVAVELWKWQYEEDQNFHRIFR